MANTSSVTITLTLDTTSAGPPFNMSNCQVQVALDDGTSSVVNGWNIETIPDPVTNGASFSLNISDHGYNSSNISSVANWALTFVPRSGTTQQSPFGNNQNTLTGSGGIDNGAGSFSLSVNNSKIKQSGVWDWVFLVQMNTGPTGQQVVKCFASDPEMDVEF